MDFLEQRLLVGIDLIPSFCYPQPLMINPLNFMNKKIL